MMPHNPQSPYNPLHQAMRVLGPRQVRVQFLSPEGKKSAWVWAVVTVKGESTLIALQTDCGLEPVGGWKAHLGDRVFDVIGVADGKIQCVPEVR